MPQVRAESARSPILVAIVEDDPEFLDALCKAVQAVPDLRLAGMAGTRAAGIALLQNDPAHVLLVDLGLPDGSGIDVIRAATLRWPDCSIMVSTNFGDETSVMRSIESGAAGYLLKDSSPAKIVDEIRSLASGGSPISPIIARQVLMRFRHAGLLPSPAGPPGPPGPHSPAADPLPAGKESGLLSSREKEVLDYITKGFTANEIAKLMRLSPFTVRSFVRRIYGKLKVTSKAEAIYEARNQGLLAD